MIKADKYYIRNLNKILKFGSFDMNPRPKYIDGEHAHTKYITQVFEEYDISKGEFPITTLRNTAIKTGIKEILWIYQKQSNSLKVAKENGILWWDEWDIGDGTIGNRYGFTVCKYDLLNKTLDGLKSDPFSRRHIINLYQYDDLESSGGLYPCAYEVIFSVRLFRGELFLDMTLMQRSSDYIMAGYINKTQYVSFLMMVAGHCNYKVGKFVHFVQNLHIYDRHFNAAKEIIERSKINNGVQPLIVLKENKNFYDYSLNDFIIENNVGEKLKSQLEIAI
jgi:thymidylate synthase